MAFIRTSEWETQKVFIRKKALDGGLTALEWTDAGGMSRDLSIKGVHVKKGGASLHKVHEKFVLKPNDCVVLETREHITSVRLSFVRLMEPARERLDDRIQRGFLMGGPRD